MRPIPKPRTPQPGRPPGRFTQHRRLDRLREALEGHPAGITLGDLAALLHVTSRSVRRYLHELELLTELESLETTPGGAHVWRIKPSERGRAVPLRRPQAYGLLAARRVFDVMKGSAFFDDLDHAHRQILQVATRPSRAAGRGEIQGDRGLEDRFVYVPHPPASYGPRADELDDLFLAVADLRVLRFRYRSEGRAERVVAHPYAMLLHKGSIHMVAKDLETDDVRTFVFDRMAEATSSDTERFTLPDELRVEDFIHGQFGIARGTAKARVMIEFEARVADEIRGRKVHPSQKIGLAADGRVRLSMTVAVEALPEVKRWVLGFGEAARVIDPPELMADVARALMNAWGRYR